jgi:hypothetical protein
MKKLVGLIVLVLFSLNSFSQGQPLQGNDAFKTITYLKNGDKIIGAIVSTTDTTTIIRIRHYTLKGYEYENNTIKNLST